MDIDTPESRRHRPKIKAGRKRALPSPPRSKSWSTRKVKTLSPPKTKQRKTHTSPKVKTKLVSKFINMSGTSKPTPETTPKSAVSAKESAPVKRQIRVSPRTLEKKSPSSGYPSKAKVKTPEQRKRSETTTLSVKKNVKQAALMTPLTAGRRRSIMARTPGRSTSMAQTPAPITPYRTPHRMPLNQTPAADMKDAEKRFQVNAAVFREELKGLLNKSMKISNLSSMSNFFYQRKIYRTKYEKELKNKIHQYYPLPMLKVSIAKSSCLRYHERDIDAIRISVTSVIFGDTRENDRIATIYIAWLFHSTQVQTSKSNNVWFPIMLHTGRDSVHSLVIDWLQGVFGCYIAKSGIRRWDLLWMTGVWSGWSCPNPSHSKDDDNQVSLIYHIRSPMGQPRFSTHNTRGKPRLLIRLPLREIRHIWESIVGSSTDEINLTQLRQFFSCMDSLVADFLKLPISYLSIMTFTAPCMSLSADGKVRLTCRRGAWYVLNHLSQIFIKSTTSSVFKEYFKGLSLDGEENADDEEEDEEEDEDEDEDEDKDEDEEEEQE